MASIKCKSCGHDNPTEARFCANCGSKLTATEEKPAPVPTPGVEVATPRATIQYMGFWIRLAAAILDGLIVFGVLCIIGPLIYILMHRASVFTPLYFLLPFLYYWLFTGLRGQTLGKMVCGIKVVNAEGSAPGLVFALLRELPGKILATIPVYLGYLWIIWDGQKQGWHDKIANTYVVRVESRR
jgi:uncharacterized RDD family membrane protein YckC